MNNVKNVELNEYIFHYLEEDRTKSAIMLTGDWGIGKSYYISNELIGFLDGKGYQCVVISVYGLESTDDISKNIYFGLLSNRVKINNEIQNAGWVVAKNVVKNLMSIKGIDLSIEEKDVIELCKLVNLSKTLVVVEDIERAEIGLPRLLGYINNLVEHDNVKVLLVANENEIIKETKLESGDKPEENRGALVNINRADKNAYTDDTKKYLTIKEKTVSDTIRFDGDYEGAIRNIIRSFENEVLNSLCDNETVNDVKECMLLCRNYNLRAFLFACQKTVDLFKYLGADTSDDYKKCIFYSILAFSFRIKQGKRTEWQKDSKYSFDFGTSKYPLFKFCYDYIIYQKIEREDIKNSEETLKKIRLYDQYKTQNDEDVLTLYNYHIKSEKEIIKAVESITRRLENVNDISFFEYGSIAAYLCIIKHLLDVDTSTASMLLVDNLRGRGSEIDPDSLFRKDLSGEKDDVQRDYLKIKDEIYLALKGSMDIPGFDYKPAQSEKFYDYVCKNTNRFLSDGEFAANLDVEKIIKMFSNASPEEMDAIRGAFWTVYRAQNVGEFYKNDKENLLKLQKGIGDYIKESKGDKIQMIQANWFYNNLGEFIRKL